MAIGLQNTDNVDPADSDYPYGKVRDDSGTGDGTPATKKTLGDFHQFFARLLDKAGMIPNGLPDNDYSGFQYFEAFSKFTGEQFTKEIPIGDWDMDATNQVNLPHGLDHTKIRDVRVIIISDSGGSYTDLCVGGSSTQLDGSYQVTTTNVILRRNNGGAYDTAGYDNSPFNRGFVTIKYVA